MIDKSDIENFWTRGDIYSRVHQAMLDSGLNDKKLEIEDLFPIDQYHARGICDKIFACIDFLFVKKFFMKISLSIN